jgi:molybdopterin-guanine dinucleotide biosynthesis protein A
MTILCILAGGESSRFGQSKLNVHIDGQPILAWHASYWSAWPAVGIPKPQLWLSLPFGNTPLPPGHHHYSRIIRDRLPFQGPLAGIASVLEHAPQTGIIAFIPADMPLIHHAHLSMLLIFLQNTQDALRACYMESPGLPEERIHPFPLLMDLAHARQSVAAAQEKGIRGPSGLCKTPGTTWATIPSPYAPRLHHSINTPLDLRFVAQVLRKPVTVGE